VTGGGSSLPEVQRLLAVLAAGRRCAEIGTAFGDGAAAMASTAASLVTVERDPDRAAVAQERLGDLGNVRLIVGDWREVLPPLGPFELVFFDGGHFDAASGAVDLVAPQGLLVKDDLSPRRPAKEDAVRGLLFGHPELVAAEVLTTPSTAAIVAARRPRTSSRRVGTVASHTPE
jgi:predicted O-methyltransferase YrrM